MRECLAVARSRSPSVLASLVLVVACGQALPTWAACRPPELQITSVPEIVASGVASSQYSEVRLAVSPDHKVMLWGSTDRPGGPGGWNVWLSRRGDAAWSAPVPAPFDSEANDFDPAFSPDGRFVYFFSNRPGGLGGDDIYRVAVTGDAFGPVEHLGPEVNSAGDEWAPAPSPDGTSLLFATNGRGGAGRHDLFVARATATGFAAAERLPGAINTPADEFDATFLSGGAVVAFARSNDVEHDPILLYVAGRCGAGYDRGAPLPATVNVDGGYTLGPSVDASDPKVLYFSGHRPEASVGKLDLYRVHLRVRP